MPEQKYMILHDTAKKGREIFIGQDAKPQHIYAESGVDKLVKLTVRVGGWGDFRHAVKVKDQIWVSYAWTLAMLDTVWYPLQPLDWDVWQSDYNRNQEIIAEIKRKLGEWR